MNSGLGIKIKSEEELKKIILGMQAAKRKVVFTNGCFDVIHAGHIDILQQAKSFGDILIVAMNTDESVRSFKGESRPIFEFSERARVISALSCVDFVVSFSDREPSRIIANLKPDIHVKGGDYDPNNYDNLPEARVVHEYGGEVKIIPLTKGKSTTATAEKIMKL